MHTCKQIILKKNDNDIVNLSIFCLKQIVKKVHPLILICLVYSRPNS